MDRSVEVVIVWAGAGGRAAWRGLLILWEREEGGGAQLVRGNLAAFLPPASSLMLQHLLPHALISSFPSMYGGWRRGRQPPNSLSWHVSQPHSIYGASICMS